MNAYEIKKAFAGLGLALALLAGLAGCGEVSVEAAPERSRKAVPVKPVHLPPPVFQELESGDLAASLSDVYFELDSAALTAKARFRLRRALLPRVRDFLARGGAAVLVRGYTDGLGSRAYNRNLSRRRAGAVAALLVAGGVDSGHVQTYGYGESGARDGVDDPSARRVVVVLHGAAL